MTTTHLDRTQPPAPVSFAGRNTRYAVYKVDVDAEKDRIEFYERLKDAWESYLTDRKTSDDLIAVVDGVEARCLEKSGELPQVWRTLGTEHKPSITYFSIDHCWRLLYYGQPVHWLLPDRTSGEVRLDEMPEYREVAAQELAR